jgi:hypothetical protein
MTGAQHSAAPLRRWPPMAPDLEAAPAAYVTEIAVPAPVTELHRLHSPMPAAEPEAAPEAEL